MSYTGTDIFTRAIAIKDDLSDTGTVTADVSDLQYRAPHILDLWQKEMAAHGALYAVEEYTNSDEENVYKWTKESLPTDFKSVREIIFIDSDSQMYSIKYRQFGSDIYFYYKGVGTVRMLYIPIPAAITALTQTLAVDDITASCAAYYLDEQFALSEQDTDVSKWCGDKYKELRDSLILQSPFIPEEIEDVYGCDE
jgi:hypothetical protein